MVNVGIWKNCKQIALRQNAMLRLCAENPIFG